MHIGVHSKEYGMNERIKELSEQAEKYADDNFRGEPTWSEAFESKFAELIVRECMSIIKQGEGLGEEDDFDKGFQAGIAMAYNRVRTQMGVEE